MLLPFFLRNSKWAAATVQLPFYTISYHVGSHVTLPSLGRWNYCKC